MLHKVMASSVLWLPLTLGIYIGACEAYRRAGKAPLLNPTLLTICSVCAFLVVFPERKPQRVGDLPPILDDEHAQTLQTRRPGILAFNQRHTNVPRHPVGNVSQRDALQTT